MSGHDSDNFAQWGRVASIKKPDYSEKVDSVFATRFVLRDAPKYEMPPDGTPADAVYSLISQELALDGNPKLNLASFVTTWMEPQAERLMAEGMSKNFIDLEEYPQTTELHNRCVNMIARLFHAPLKSTEPATGAGCVGSSEAIMLAGLAMKWRWRERRRAEGKPYDRPNLVMGSNVQVCWKKFCRYFDVEEKCIPVAQDCFVTRPELLPEYCDENTIGVCGILGTTYTGDYEDIKAMNDYLVEIEENNNWGIMLHVDAASGGFVAPFNSPDLIWDFQLPMVCSINVSGHKYGLTYPGVGWVVWRSPEYLPQDLIFHVNYLGSDQPTFTLNFSKGASQIIAQYYQLVRLGKAGYKAIMNNLLWVTREIKYRILDIGRFRILNDTHALPLVAFALTGDPGYDEFDVSHQLRARGWIVPAYTMAPDAQHVKLLRVVIREGFTIGMVDILMNDLQNCIEHLDHLAEKMLRIEDSKDIANIYDNPENNPPRLSRAKTQIRSQITMSLDFDQKEKPPTTSTGIC